jgi:hypothetical protein
MPPESKTRTTDGTDDARQRDLARFADDLEQMARSVGAHEIKRIDDDGERKIWGLKVGDTPISLSVNITP